MRETIGFSRVEFQFEPNLKSLMTWKETIGFSRMESQFQPNHKSLPRSKETIGFSRMESQFQPNHHPFTTSCRLHPTKVEGSLKLKSRQHLRLKLRLHAAEADGLFRSE